MCVCVALGMCVVVCVCVCGDVYGTGDVCVCVRAWCGDVCVKAFTSLHVHHMKHNTSIIIVVHVRIQKTT